MPSKSKAQQRFMAQAYQVRKWIDSNGKEGTNPKDIDKEYRDDITRIAKDMKKGDLKKYAETKHKNLPDKVNEGFEPGDVLTHKYIKSLTIELIEPTNKGWKVMQKNPKGIGAEKKGKIAFFDSNDIKNIFEDAATIDNVNGMGPVSFPDGDIAGSGDIPIGGTSKFLTFKEFVDSFMPKEK